MDDYYDCLYVKYKTSFFNNGILCCVVILHSKSNQVPFMSDAAILKHYGKLEYTVKVYSSILNNEFKQ